MVTQNVLRAAIVGRKACKTIFGNVGFQLSICNYYYINCHGKVNSSKQTCATKFSLYTRVALQFKRYHVGLGWWWICGNYSQLIDEA